MADSDPTVTPETVPSGLGAATVAVPISQERVAEWQLRVEASKRAVAARAEEWKDYVAAYMGHGLKERPTDHTVTVPLEFSFVELKKAQLAFQVPEVNLKPTRPEYAAAVRVFEGALNHELRETGIDATLDEVLTDVLICGIAAVKVGYSADVRTRVVPVLEPVVDPLTGQPVLDPQTQQPAQRQAMRPAVDPATGALILDPVTNQPVQEPAFQEEPYVAAEEYCIDRIPPECLLVPVEFSGADYDKAAWLGWKGRLDLETARKRFHLPPDFAPTATKPRETLSSDERPEGREALTTKEVEFVEIFYRTAVYDPEAQALPGAYRHLVLVKDYADPVVHADCPYQYVDEQDGRLKGMDGNPIHVLTLRYLPGDAYPVSDVGISRSLSEELSLGRSQMLQFRDRVMPLLGVNTAMIGPELKEKLEAPATVKIGRVLPVNGPPAEAVQPIAVAQFPRDNFKFDDIVNRDVERAWAMGRNQMGLTEDGEPPTATEVQASQAATDTRLAREQTKVLRWFTRLARKFGALLQMFKDEPSYAEIVGPDGVTALRAWNRHSIQGEFVFTARPDSALRLDAQADRAQKLQLYTQLGNDPNVNRVELLKALLIAHSLDPAKIVVEQLPEKGPEPPRVSYSFKGEDFSISSPQFPLVLAIAQQGGLQIPPEAIQNAKLLMQQLQAMAVPQPAMPGQPQAEHPGATTPVEPLNKHAAERDGVPRPAGAAPVM